MIAKKHVPAAALISVGVLLFVILVFVKIDLDSHEVVMCELYGSDPDLEMQDCPAHNSTSDWLLTIGFALSILLIVSGAYLWYSPLIREEEEKKEVDMSKLDEDEQAIMQVVLDADGSAYQSDVVKETGLSKVKTSRTLDRLEQKGLVERKRRGMTNLVVQK